MKKIDFLVFSNLIEGGYERRDLEFKSPYKWLKKKEITPIQAMTIKGVIALSNLPLGGLLIVGVVQKEKKFQLKGLNKSEFDTFKDYDQIKGVIDGFVYNSISFEMEYTEDDNDQRFIVFKVQGFEKYPLICKKDLTIGSQKYLDHGTIYVRRKSSIPSSDRATDVEIREIIDESVKKVSDYWYGSNFQEAKTVNGDKVNFDNQIGDIKL